jgi:hypothetical protein
MTHKELTDEEALTAAMLLGFEWEPLRDYDLFGFSEFGFYNSPHGKLLAMTRQHAVRLYLQYHLPEKTPEP